MNPTTTSCGPSFSLEKNGTSHTRKKYPNGTPLSEMTMPAKATTTTTTTTTTMESSTSSSSSSSLTVVSMNLLAEAYVRPMDRRTGSIQPFAAFEWICASSSSSSSSTAGQDVLDISSRGPRLLKVLQTCDADVICLQELQLGRRRRRQNDGYESSDNNNNNNDDTFHLPLWLKPINEKYSVHLPPHSELVAIANRNLRVLDKDVAVTCAVLVVKRNNIRDNNDNGGGGDSVLHVVETTSCPSTASSSSSSSSTTSDTNTCVTVLVRRSEWDHAVAVASIHMDATSETKRVGQLAKCLKRARSLLLIPSLSSESSSQEKNDVFPEEEWPLLSLIIAGDFNTELEVGSCVAAVLDQSLPLHDDDKRSEGQEGEERSMKRECASAHRIAESDITSQQMNDWYALHQEAQQLSHDFCTSLDRVPTQETRSAFNHASATTDHQDDGKDPPPPPVMMQWSLDHILYTTDTLQPVAYWATLEDDPESCRVGLPNQRCGSDHLPIGAMFQVLKQPKLLPIKRQALLCRLHDMDHQQQDQLKRTEESFDMEQKSHEEKLPLPLPPPQGRKTKRTKPTSEMIELLRRRRAAMKTLKVQLRQERETLIAELGNLERLAVEQEYGFTATQWIHRVGTEELNL